MHLLQVASVGEVVGMRALVVLFTCLVFASCSGPNHPQNASKGTQAAPVKKTEAQAEPANKESTEKWEKIATFGAITTVYMSPNALADKYFIAQVLHTLRSGARIQQVWFFDKRSETPTGVPMTDSQMLHWRAKYAVNANTGYEEFIYLTVINSQSSPPELSQRKANIRPGFAE